MMYLAAFFSALIVDTIPVFAPPAWTILTFLILKFKLNPWAVVALGAVGSSIGRFLLTLFMPKISGKILSRRENHNVAYVGRRLRKSFWSSFLFVLFYSLTPLSTTALFTAAGLARLEILPILPAFFIGKFTSDAAMVFTGKYAAGAGTKLFQGHISWQSVVMALAGSVLILGVMFIDWPALLERRRLVLHFKIWA